MRSLLWGVLLLCAWPAVSQEAAGLVDERGRASQQLSVAENHFLRGEDRRALESYRKARELFLAAGDQLGQGDTWRGEAKVLLRLGEKKEALEACETARQLFRAARERFLATRDQLRLGHTWYGEAEILYQLGEKDTQALYGYGRARQLYVAAGSKLEQGNAWRGEADVLSRLRKNQEAVYSYGKAQQLFRSAGDSEGEGDTWLGEALAWIAMSRHPVTQLYDSAVNLRKAIKAAAAAVTQYQHAGIVPKQISALLIQAKAETAEEELRARMSQAISNMQRGTATPMGTAWVSLIFEGTRKSAARSLEEAIRRHGLWRGTGTTDSDRTAREEIIREAYDFLVTLRARQKGQGAEALRLAEEARSRVLLDLLAAPPPFRYQPELELSVTQEEVFPQEPPLDVAAIQSLTRETGPLLVYYTTESEAWGFLILPETAEISVRSIAISESELKAEIYGLNKGLANSVYERDAVTHAYRLWYFLIHPFLKQLPKIGPLVLVPHGPLHELPFEALRDAEGKRLFERWQISITPSVSALALARSRHAAPLSGDSFLGISSGRGLDLPEVEVAKIFGFFGTGKITVANYQNYRESVSQARHLLISTRGVYTKGSRTGTFLEIEPTPEVHDSRLTAAEIATIPLRAELVTLAACDTSYGEPLMSDERLDLTRSFLIAGAAAVLASRWKVPEDEATSQFLADFYQAYRQGGPQGTGLRKDEALTEARRRSRERHDSAQVWAGWVLIGDPR